MDFESPIDPRSCGNPTFFAANDPNRVVRSLWIGPVSPLERLCMESFVRCGHEFHLFMYDPVADLPPGVVVRDAASILSPARVFRNRLGKGKGSYAGFADVFRYQMLHDLGGWWVDMDLFCLKPFAFDAPYVFGSEDKPVANGVIKAPRGCDLMRRVCEECRQIDADKVWWNEAGEILYRAVHELDLLGWVQPPETFSPIVWHELPQYVRGKRQFTPGGASYAVHLYHEMWRRNKLDKWKNHGPRSVVEILKRHAGLPTSVADPTATGWARWLPWRRAA